jgi:hypothetical protein
MLIVSRLTSVWSGFTLLCPYCAAAEIAFRTTRASLRRYTKYSNYMQQSPSWEANSPSASQEIPRLLWNANVHCRVHKRPPLVSLLSQMKPIYTFPPPFPKIYSNIILLFTPTSSEWSRPFKYSEQYVYVSHPSPSCYIPRPSYPPQYDHPKNIWWSVQILKLIM